jgi:hypothetical protein
VIHELTPALLATLLLALLLLAAPLTLLISLAIRLAYRRAVVRAMARASAAPGRADPPTSEVVPVSPTGRPPAPPAVDAQRGERALRDDCVRTALTGAAFAAVMCVAAVLAVPLYRTPGRTALTFWVYLWPTVLALWNVGPPTARWRAAVAGAYALPWLLWTGVAPWLGPARGALLADVAAVHRATVTPTALLFTWSLVNVLPTLLHAASLNRWLRAMGPLVLAFVSAWIALLFVAFVALYSPTGMQAAGALAGRLSPLPPAAVLVLLLLAMLAGAAAAAAIGLHRLRRAYLERRINERGLQLGAIWLLFAASDAMALSTVGVGWAFAPLPALAVAAAVASWLRRHGPWQVHAPDAPAGLTFLRVFALGARSERLFDALARRWRHLGPMRFITGPDLALATVQPHQLLDFLVGRLDRHFIDGVGDLQAHLAGHDRSPDADGRFRPDNLFCRADTWRPALAALVGEGDRVLLDLRAFGPTHAGCRFELRHLVHHVPLDRWLIVIDGRTDTAHVDACLAEAWAELPADSPNLGTAPRTVRRQRLAPGDRGVHGLLSRLCRAD